MPKPAPCEVRGAVRWESAKALLISDLHLSPQSPEALRAFRHLLAAYAAQFDSLLILGDLFEVYAGDDALENDAFVAEIAVCIKVASTHCRIGLMHGNRDFLMGQDFCIAAGATLLADPCVLVLPAPQSGENPLPLLLSHGDRWCTLDTPYQTKKIEIRSPQWQNQLLAMPWAQRWALASSYREQSMAQRAGSVDAAADAQANLYDVVPSSFAASCAEFGVVRGLHGHTHAPAQHPVSAAAGARTVLGDWQFDPSANHGLGAPLSHAAIVGHWQAGALALMRYDGANLHATKLAS